MLTVTILPAGGQSHERRRNAGRTGFDGRDGGSRKRLLRRFHAARRVELPDQRNADPQADDPGLGLIKWAAAGANRELGGLDAERAGAIEEAALEVADGRLDEQFVVDVFQTGSGTSSNMNANEVIANRAAEILGAERGARDRVHPNDHT